MIKTKLNLRLLSNYEQKIREYLQQLKKDGYVISSDTELTESIHIIHYNCQKQDFSYVCHIDEFFDKVIDPNVANPFNIPISSSVTRSLIAEILPYAVSSDLCDFLLYEKYELDYMGNDELDSELKDFTNLSKSLVKEIDLNNFTNPNNQAQILNSELVFYTGNSKIATISQQRKYYKYNKKTKSFDLMNANHIHQLLVKKFKINDNSLDLRSIKRNMRTIYTELVNCSDLPIKWNRNVLAREKLNQYEKHYKEMKKITDCFE